MMILEEVCQVYPGGILGVSIPREHRYEKTFSKYLTEYRVCSSPHQPSLSC